MSIQPAYLPDTLVAYHLGRKVTWLRAHRPKLEADGFPRKDKLVGMTLRADLEAWIAKRRSVGDPDKAQIKVGRTTTPLSGERLDVL
jgi:hypothetical protein